MRRLRWLAILTAAAAVLALAGCGGGGSKDKTSTASAGGGSPSGATADASAQGKATSAKGSTPAPTTKSSGGSVPDIKTITKKFADSTFQASYTVTTTTADATGGKMQLFKDGQDKFRFDITTQQGGQDMAVMVIQNGATSAFCMKDAGQLAPLLGVAAGTGVCFKSNPGDPNNPLGNLSTTFSDLVNADVTVLETSTRTVAGRDAACYREQDNKTQDISTICFGSDGTMLYEKSEGTDASEIVATDVQSSVQSSDFDLPYEVKDFPATAGQ